MVTEPSLSDANTYDPIKSGENKLVHKIEKCANRDLQLWHPRNPRLSRSCRGTLTHGLLEVFGL